MFKVSYGEKPMDTLEKCSLRIDGLSIEHEFETEGANTKKALADCVEESVLFDEALLIENEERNFVDRCADLVSKIDEKRYKTLVLWMIGVMYEFDHDDATVQIAINILVRYLSAVNLTPGMLQLAGVTAIWIADKSVHVYPDKWRRYIGITDDTYTATEIKRMEAVILDKLESRLMLVPRTACSFADHVAERATLAPNDRKFIEYLLCAGFVDPDHLKYRSSLLANAAVLVASVVFQSSRGEGEAAVAVVSRETVEKDRDALALFYDMTALQPAVAFLCRVGSENLLKPSEGGNVHMEDKYKRTHIFYTVTSREELRNRLECIAQALALVAS